MSGPKAFKIVDLLVEARDLLTCVMVLREHDEFATADDIEAKLAVRLNDALAIARAVHAADQEAAA